MTVMEGLVEALKLEHAHIERVRSDFNSCFDARKRAQVIVKRITEMQDVDNKEYVDAMRKDAFDEPTV